MYDFFMKEIHFLQQITNIGTSRFVNSHRQRVCYRMTDSLRRSDAQGADATPSWNTLYVVPDVYTDNGSNKVSILNELHTFSLPRQATWSTIRIPRVAHTANLTLADFLMEARGAKLCDIRRIFVALPDYTGASFSNIAKLREDR
jgi:hypothetical protein